MNFPKIKPKAFLAPMADVNDLAYRILCKEYGAGMVYTQLLSSSAIIRNDKKTSELLKTNKKEKPVAVQLFGDDSKEMAEAAQIVEPDFDVIDVNCGCPAPKVLRSGGGSNLLKNPELIGKIINKISSKINKPVSLKIRSGISDKNINALSIAKIAEDNGASAITLHARTQKQGYRGESDWDLIKKLKESVNIKVIGNGDIDSPELFKEKLEETDVDYIMIGRGAIGRPYIFSQINEYIKTGKYKEDYDQLKIFNEYLEIAEKFDIPFYLVKLHAMHFSKGLKNAAKIRKTISKSRTITSFKKALSKA